MNREHYEWYSPNLQRHMELLVFGHSGARVIVFPTRVGRFFDYENWRIVAAIRQKIEEGHLQLFCVDSVDSESLYCDWCHPSGRIERHLQYEQYIIHEVLPFTESHNPNTYLIAHGCSLGAYHALNFGLRHPTRFNKIVSFSGRYDISSDIGSYRDLFDGYRDDNIYFNNPTLYLPNMTDPDLIEQLRTLEIIITIGEDDVLLENNKKISRDLWAKGVEHQFYIWGEEAHRAKYWRQMAHLYL